MKEAIISQVMLTFQKAIKKFAKKTNEPVENTSFSFFLSANVGKKVQIFLCTNYVIVSEIESKDIMGMTLNFSGLGSMIMEYIHGILVDFSNEEKSKNVEVGVCLNRDDDEMVDFFLYVDGNVKKQFLLQDVLKV
jgi:hypothetical protein